jgi:hypothetical protein
VQQVFSKLFLPQYRFYSFSAARFCCISIFLPLPAAGDLPLKCPTFHYGILMNYPLLGDTEESSDSESTESTG